jgi:hypothetical protein
MVALDPLAAFRLWMGGVSLVVVVGRVGVSEAAREGLLLAL